MNHVLLRGVMQRHKASVEVKQVIGTLCKLLTATGLQHVPTPETFRRAKFGEVDVEDRLWQLLANILQTTTVSSAGCTQMINVTAEHRMLVSTGLWQSGYYAGWMYGREVGGVSSRELLLALGWVLAAGTLEKLLTQRVQQLDKILLPPILMKVEIPHDPLVECSSVRRLQWLIGCLKHQGRILLSMQDERASLLHAVFSTSLTSGLSSSGQSCTALNETCIGVQELCDLLGLYLNWKQVENVFWTWMDSVVDYHVKDAVAKRPTQIVTRAADACHPGQLAVDKLEDVLLRLKTVQKGQKTGRGDVMDRKCRLQDTLDTDMCYLESFPPLLSVSQPYRARFQAEKTVNSWSVKTLHGMVKETNELPVSQVVELLTHTERQLLEGRDTQRLANRIQLQEMIGRLNELVLITP
ncbi:tubulin epsilon and delta complex protein 1 isoform X2 [Phyllopteryx taeniolatus]|uniref:tubulin epsilon and delta complex protein 1 isoform X2 n=1 Tax=Phyllopteryx taeniolatus TaxID=161469 RepID=UPI002AD37213|nr:tubulin epsilon and delta complex protein 1 isoform X2 [Phyllopteryx taeniolatus]